MIRANEVYSVKCKDIYEQSVYLFIIFYYVVSTRPIQMCSK